MRREARLDVCASLASGERKKTACISILQGKTTSEIKKTLKQKSLILEVSFSLETEINQTNLNLKIPHTWDTIPQCVQIAAMIQKYINDIGRFKN